MASTNKTTWNKRVIVKKAIYIILTWILAAIVIAIFYWRRETTPVKEFVSWALSVWPILTVIGVVGASITGWIIKHKLKDEQEKSAIAVDDSLILLGLLDEVYQRLKHITRLTIRKMRSKKWEAVTSAYPYFMSLTDIDVDAEIENILFKNLGLFISGKPMTVIRDSKQLATRIQKSPLFTCNPEGIAKDASVILQEKVPYLKKKLDHDRIYKKLLKRIERERDKYPVEEISNTIDEYLSHSIKINAAWVLSTYDLDHWGIIEGIAGRRVPMKLKIILWGLPGRMDEEMRGYRTRVAVSILQYHREHTK